MMVESRMINRNVVLLAVCQGLMLSCTSLAMATSALIGARLTVYPEFATLPLGLTYLSMMATMIPGSLLMKKFGRRCGFMLGGFSGMAGGLTSAWAIYHGSFALFCLGSALFGVANGFGQFYRFAAAEVVDETARARAISWVLAGGLVAAFIGPNVARVSRDMIPGGAFSASYLFVALFCLGVVLVQFTLKIPRPSAEEVSGEKRPLSHVLSRPVFLVAALCAMIAYGTMNLLMTATPLAMFDCGMPFSDTANVIQWHIVGMFAPSFFTGSLIQRFGVLKIMFCGAILLMLCALTSLFGEQYSHFFIGLLFLGLGWNFLFIGATTLLTEVYLPAEKGVVQGINDFLVFSATAFTALTAGFFHHQLGWELLNTYTLLPVGFAALIIILLGIRQQRSMLRLV